MAPGPRALAFSDVPREEVKGQLILKDRKAVLGDSERHGSDQTRRGE